MGETVLDFLAHNHAAASQHGLQAAGEIVFAVGLGHKVKYGQAVFVLCQSQAAAQLLQKNSHAIRRTQEQHRVDCRNIDAFVEQIDDKEERNLPCFQQMPCLFPFAVRCIVRVGLK